MIKSLVTAVANDGSWRILYGIRGEPWKTGYGAFNWNCVVSADDGRTWNDEAMPSSPSGDLHELQIAAFKFLESWWEGKAKVALRDNVWFSEEEKEEDL